jgi:hypothetical protein
LIDFLLELPIWLFLNRVIDGLMKRLHNWAHPSGS